MKILHLKKVVNMAEFYLGYEAYLKSRFNKGKAYTEIAKIKTSLLRFVLPEWGFILKVDGNLSPSETIDGLKFMEQIPIHQAVHALETQRKVFDRFGDRVSAASRRVYRSALRKMMDWGRSQEWWTQSVEPTLDGKTPTMLVPQKRVEHWHKLKPKELPPNLSQQLDALSTYMLSVRQPNLAKSSWIRYSRELLGVFGWLYRVKGIPLAELSLTHLVSVEATRDMSAAEQVVDFVREYLQWLRANIGDKNATLRFALHAFTYVAEYIHYETQKLSPYE